MYFVFSEPIQKYLIKVFQIHIFKSILYFVFEQRKKVSFTTLLIASLVNRPDKDNVIQTHKSRFNKAAREAEM